MATCATQRKRSEENCAWVRRKIAERGWTAEIELEAVTLISQVLILL